MINKIVCNAEDLTAIADAVRASNGSTNTYNVPELSAAAVNAIGTGGTTVQSDWAVNDESDPAYVKGRTHWVERVYEPIVWDGNTEGRDMIDVGLAFGEPAGAMLAYKISDTIFDTETLLSSTTFTTIGAETYSAFILDATDGSAVAPVIPEGFVVFCNYGTMIQTEYGEEDFARGMLFVFRQAGDFSNSLGIVIPSAGLYAFMFNPHLLELRGKEVYHTVDMHYLPELEVGRNIKFGYPIWLPSPRYRSAMTFNSESNYAEDEFSSAFGEGTITGRACQHVFGRFNVYTNDALLVVGNGISDNKRSNAHTINSFGSAWFAGNIRVGGTGQDDAAAVAVLTENDMQRIIQQTIAALPVYGGETE